MYAIVLSYERYPRLQAIDEAHRHVLGRLAEGIGGYVPGVRHVGISDLALGDRKFSGNSLRAKRRHFLYHGTLLYDFPLSVVGRYLARPPREPEYRGGRGHAEFLVNLPLGSSRIAGSSNRRVCRG